MKKITLAAAVLAAALGAVVFAQQRATTSAANTITVYKTPT
ncbi:MAG TPA: hypothetical protein VFZ31_16435 [Vicinamibacterales bacterium]